MGDGSFGPVCTPTRRLLNILQGLTLSGLLVLLALQCNFCVNNAIWLKSNTIYRSRWFYRDKDRSYFGVNATKESSQVESVWHVRLDGLYLISEKHYNCAQAWGARWSATVNTRDILPHLANLEALLYCSWISVINIDVNFYLTCNF